MTFDEYQAAIKKLDVFKGEKYDLCDGAFLEKILGFVGEAGEVADKFKKIIRDKDGKISATDRKEIAKELGDTLWYLATIARYLDLSFDEIATGNIAKLTDRAERDLIHGTGDNR